MTLDISKPEGQQVARRLAATADVLIENYIAGDLTRYNLGYEQLKTLNPGLIYCSITGFGQTGPMKHVAGYDFIIRCSMPPMASSSLRWATMGSSRNCVRRRARRSTRNRGSFATKIACAIVKCWCRCWQQC